MLRWLFHGDDLVVGVVERGTDKIVHPSVSDDEGFAVLFDDEDAGEERASLGDDKRPGSRRRWAFSPARPSLKRRRISQPVGRGGS